MHMTDNKAIEYAKKNFCKYKNNFFILLKYSKQKNETKNKYTNKKVNYQVFNSSRSFWRSGLPPRRFISHRAESSRPIIVFLVYSSDPNFSSKLTQYSFTSGLVVRCLRISKNELSLNKKKMFA